MDNNGASFGSLTPSHSPSKMSRSGRNGSSLPGTPSRRAALESFTPETPRNSEKLLLPCSPRARAHTPDSPRSRKTSTPVSAARREVAERASSVGSVGSVGSPSRRSRTSTVGSVSCPDSPRSFQRLLETASLGSTYSETRRQTKRERSEFRKYQKEVHRENSAELSEIKTRTRPRVDDRISQHARQAEKAWQEFHARIRGVDAEDMEIHRNHLMQIICNAEPRVSASMSPRASQARRKCSEDRVESLMRELNSWRENERDLEQLTLSAQPKVSDDLSDMTKDVRKRLGMLRAGMRSYDSKVFALQERTLEHLRERSASRVDSWHSEDVVQTRDLFAQRSEARRKARSSHMQKYAQELRALVEKAEPAVDAYIDDEVKGLRQFPFEVEQSEVQRLQDEIRHPPSPSKSLSHPRTAPTIDGSQSEPWWITGDRQFLVRPAQSSQATTPRTTPRGNSTTQRGIVTTPRGNSTPLAIGNSSTPPAAAVLGASSCQLLSSMSFAETGVGLNALVDRSSSSLNRVQWPAPVEAMSISTSIGTTPTSMRTPNTTATSLGSTFAEPPNSFQQLLRAVTASTRRASSPPFNEATSNETAMIRTTQQSRHSTPRAAQSFRFVSTAPSSSSRTGLHTPRSSAPVISTSPTRQITHDINNAALLGQGDLLESRISGAWRQQSSVRSRMGHGGASSPKPSPLASPRPTSVQIRRCDSIQHPSASNGFIVQSSQCFGAPSLVAQTALRPSPIAQTPLLQPTRVTPVHTPRLYDNFVQTPRASAAPSSTPIAPLGYVG